MNKRTIQDIKWPGKRALVRVDFNVPMRKGTTEISDDTRIHGALPTLRYLIKAGASIVLCTHLGRPDGEHVDDLELGPIVDRLSELLESPVRYVHDAVGQLAVQESRNLHKGEILMLENIRFFPGEESNEPHFAGALAQLADIYVNDAFGTAHRAHASTAGVANHLPSVAGLLMEKEISMLSSALDSPNRPLAAVLGGAKVSDKTKVLERVLNQADSILIGGGMAGTFFKAKGFEIGNSLLEPDKIPFCKKVIETATTLGDKLHLPDDLIVTKAIEPDQPTVIVEPDQIPVGWTIADIGPKTANRFANILKAMATVVWNGPMGIFELSPFDQGTKIIANALAESSALSIIGGGSTAEAVNKMGLENRMSHVSTGGGASLEFLEGTMLPGIAALDDR